MTSLTDSFTGKAALLLLTTALATTGCATPGLYGGYPSGGGYQQGNQNYPTQPAPVQQQQRVHVTGKSPCGDDNIDYYPLTNQGAQQCGNVGVILGRGVGDNLVVKKSFNLLNESQANQFTLAIDRLDRNEQNEQRKEQRANDSAIRNAQGQQRQTYNDPLGLKGTNDTLRDVRRTTSTGRSIIRQGQQILNIFK